MSEILYEKDFIKLEKFSDRNIVLTWNGKDFSIAMEDKNKTSGSVMLPQFFSAIWHNQKLSKYDEIKHYEIEEYEKTKRNLETIKEAFSILKGEE
jgi:hypothetical protein